MYGVTAAGFVKKNFDEIEVEVRESLESKIGAINLTPGSVFSQIVYSFIDREVELWNMLEAVYNSFYPDTAEGVSLDGVCAISGLSRLSATKTVVDCVISGNNNTSLPVGTQISTDVTNVILNIDNEEKITTERAVRVVFDVTTESLTLYKFTLNGTLYSYTKQVDDTTNDIADGLAELFDEDGYTTESLFGQITIAKNDISEHFVFYVDEGLRVARVDSVARFTAVEYGSLIVPALSATEIITPVLGWSFVYNPTSGLTGRNLETDAEFRARRSQSLKLSGSGTLEAMRARLLNLTGVTSVAINENVTNAVVDSLPAHSFEVVILGGDNQLIANIIWLLKPAGIATYGNTTLSVLDSTGRTQTVKFSRSVKRYIYANIVLTVDSSEFNTASTAVIKQSVVDKINALGTSKDVIYQSLFYSVYAEAGVVNAVITIGGNLTETMPSLSATNVVVSSTEVAYSDITKIMVTVV